MSFTLPGEEAEVLCWFSQCCMEKHSPAKMRQDAREAVDAGDDGRMVPIA